MREDRARTILIFVSGVHHDLEADGGRLLPGPLFVPRSLPAPWHLVPMFLVASHEEGHGLPGLESGLAGVLLSL